MNNRAASDEIFPFGIFGKKLKFFFSALPISTIVRYIQSFYVFKKG